MAVTAERDFHYTEQHFKLLKDLVAKHTGIALSDAKRELIYGRLSRRLRQLGMNTFDQYCALLQSGDDAELGNFVNSVTTNLTAFFREIHHFNYLERTVLPALFQKNKTSQRIRIWSAGCSTGEEPYSLAMVLAEVLKSKPGWDVKILATDIDSNVIANAARGVYQSDRISGIDQRRREQWFQRGGGGNDGLVRVDPELQDLITFKQLNLMQPWPMKGPFDVIFCRNVVIYFDKPTQRVLFDRYAEMLVSDGHLFIGHSETLFKVSERFESLGQTIYRRSR
jgi:chemotaxis protein methyltransferase CheR